MDADPATRFAIGAATEAPPGLSGELTCFANDIPFMWRNNHGRVTLTVRRRV